MKQSILNSIEYIKSSFVKLFCKRSESAHSQIDSYIEEINAISKHAEHELSAFIKELKILPKQREDQLRGRIRTLQYLPKLTRKERFDFVEHLKCFPKQTAQELRALVKHTRYFPLRIKEMTDTVVLRLGQLPLQTMQQTDALINDIGSLKLAEQTKDELVAYVHTFEQIEKGNFTEKIKHLEKESQEQLSVLADLIKTHVSGCAMLILFGSYAKGKAVIFDERYEEDGWRTTYQSDFDILIVLPSPASKAKLLGVDRCLREIVRSKYDDYFKHELHAPPQFVVEMEGALAKHLKHKNPFFAEIITEGIVLFDNGEIVLPEPKDLTFAEKKMIAQERFSNCINFADGRLCSAYMHFENGWYNGCAFDLHQATENYYRVMGLVFDNFSPKLHDLEIFVIKTKRYSRDLTTIFPNNTEFAENSFKLLCAAYIGARYNPKYAITKEELQYLMERIEKLKTATQRICLERIAYYDSKIEDK